MTISKKISPVKSLNTALRLLVALSVIAIASIFYFTYTKLKDFSDSIADASSQTITNADTIKNLKSQLTTYKPSLDKAAAITAGEDGYTNQFATDIAVYASKAGVSISGYDTNPSINTAMTNSQVSGVKSHFVTITFSNPVPYNNFVKFLYYIETNLPKMQVTGVKITPVGTSDRINVSPITVEVFTS